MANLEDILSNRSGEYQLNNAKIISAADWSWNLITKTLTWSSVVYISIPGLNLSSNNILSGSLILEINEVAYIELNLKSDIATTLPIIKVSNEFVLPKKNNLFVLIRRDGDDVVIGSQYRLMNNQVFKIGEVPEFPLVGMTLDNKSESFGVISNKSYLVSTFWQQVVATLPTANLTGNIIRFTDTDKTWGNPNSLILNSGINNIYYNNQLSNELILDVPGTWLELLWDSVNNRWSTRDTYYPASNQFLGNLTIDGNLTITGKNSITYPIKNANYLASHGDILIVGTATGPVTITLPANPQPGQNVKIYDQNGTWGTNNLTINRNGYNINSTPINLTINGTANIVELIYINSTIGWKYYKWLA